MMTLTRSMLLLCGLLAFVPSMKAEPVKKQSGKSTQKQKAAADSDQDEDKPVKKSATSKPKPKADANDDDDDKPAPKKAAVIEKKKKDEAAPPSASHPAAVSNINLDDLAGFNEYPKQVRSLIESALALTHLGLTYKFGGSNPSEGGMDCSGTIYHVLKFQGLKDVPRQSDEMCAWVRDHSQLHLTAAAQSLADDEYIGLRPGDLLFWTGTYKTDRKLPITHVMLYLGKLKKNGKPVVFGASDGRYYAGERRSGVSVFDLSLPREGSEATLYGYGPPPGLLPTLPKDIAKMETPKTSETVLAEGEMIRPAIVVPHVASKGQSSSEATSFGRPHTDEPLEPANPKPTEIASFGRPHTDEPLEPAHPKPAHEQDQQVSEAKKAPPSPKSEEEDEKPVIKKHNSIAKASDEEDDKPAAVKHKTNDTPKAKSSAAKKPVAATTRGSVAKKKPQPGAGKVALDETTEALRRAGKSIRSVFE